MGVSDEQTTVSADAMANGDGAPKKKPSLGRRILKWTLRIFLVLLVLLALGIGWLHTSHGQNFVREQVQDTVRERLKGGEFELGELDFALFGDVTLGKVKFADKRGAVAAEVATVKVVLDWGSLMSDTMVVESIEVAGVDAKLTPKPPEPKPKEPPKPKAPPPDRTIDLKSLKVTDVNVAVFQPDGTEIKVSSVDLDVALTANQLKKEVDLKKAMVTIAGIALKRPNGAMLTTGPIATNTTAKIVGDTVKAKWEGMETTAKLTRPDGKGGQQVIDVPLKFSGVDVTRDGDVANLLVSGIVAGAVSLKSIAADVKLDLAAGLAQDADQSFAINDLHLTAEQVNDILGRKALLSDVDVAFTAKGPPKKLILAGSVDSKGGKMSMKGWLDISNPLMPVYEITLSAPKVEPGKFLAGDFPKTTTSMTIAIKGKGAKRGELDASVAIDIGATKVGDRELEGVTIKATAKKGNVSLDDFTLKVLGTKITLDGTFDPETRTVTGGFNTTADVEQLVKRINEAGIFKAPLPPLKGQDVVVDMKATALLKDPESLKAAATAAPPPDDATSRERAAAALARMRATAEDSTLKGTISGKNLDSGQVKASNLKVEVDFNVKKAVPKGTIAIAVDALETKTGLKLEKIRGKFTVDGTAWQLELKAEDKPTRRKFEALVKGTVDAETLELKAELNKVLAQLGDFEATLARPVQLEIPPGGEVLGQTLRLPRTTFNVAGGTVSLTAGAKMGPDKPPAPETINADVEVKGVRLNRLPRQVRRRLRGVSGRLDASVSVRGTPTDPSVGFSVNTRVRGFGVKVNGGIADKRFDADVRLSKRGKRVATVDVSAPLIMPEPNSGKQPRLNPGGRLSVSVKVPETRIADLVGGLRPKLAKQLGDATMSMDMTTKGSARRPKVDMELTLGGIPVKQLKKTVGGTVTFGMKPEGRKHVASGTMKIQAEDGSLPPLSGSMDAIFKRSPITARDKRPESATITLDETDLAALLPNLPIPPETRKKIEGLTGKLGATIALKPDGRKMMAVEATNTIKGLSLPGKLNPIDATMEVHVDSKRIKLRNTLDDGRDGDLGEFVFQLTESPQKLFKLWKAMKITDLMKTPVTMKMTLPDTPVARFRQISPLVPELPGKVASSIAMGGRLDAPTFSGAAEYKDFETMLGKPGRAALVLNSKGSLYSTALELGTDKKLVVNHEFDGPKAFDYYLGAEEKLTTKLSITAPKMRLESLLPKLPGVDLEKVGFEGAIRSDLVAELGFGYNEDFEVVPRTPKSTGAFRFVEGKVAVPNTPRAFHDIGLAFSLDGGFKLEKLEVMESDDEKKNRSLKVTGLAPIAETGLKSATFDIVTKDFLAVAPKFNSPEGELTMNTTITASDLDQKTRKVVVDIKELHMHRPTRFVRDHYQQATHLGDLFYLKDGHTNGKLPVIKPNPVLSIGVPKDDEVMADVTIKFPKEAKILNFPLDFKLTGNMNIKLGFTEDKKPLVKLSCDVKMFDGTALVMGQPFKLGDGGMYCPGPVKEFAATFNFNKKLPDPMRRDQSQASSGGPALFKILVTPLGLPQTFPGGASGHYLIDAFATLNAGRSRMGSEPGQPATSTVQWPGGDEQPMVLTFLKTNLTHLVFLTRINLWARSGDLFEEYGRVRNMEADRYWDNDRSRVRMLGSELRTATSAAQLRYDRMLARDAQTLFGIGVYAGSNPGLGTEFFVEWSSEN